MYQALPIFHSASDEQLDGDLGANYHSNHTAPVFMQSRSRPWLCVWCQEIWASDY